MYSLKPEQNAMFVKCSGKHFVHVQVVIGWYLQARFVPIEAKAGGMSSHIEEALAKARVLAKQARSQTLARGATIGPHKPGAAELPT